MEPVFRDQTSEASKNKDICHANHANHAKRVAGRVAGRVAELLISRLFAGASKKPIFYNFISDLEVQCTIL